MVYKQLPARASRFLSVMVTVVAMALLPASADAHAVIVQATPVVDAVLSPGDIDIRLQFNSRIDVQRSRLTLQDPDRKLVAVAPVSADANVLAGRVRAEAQGVWTLHWQVLSRDGHITRGDIRFTVR